MVVLDVAGAALRDRGDRLQGGRAFELGEDRLVRATEVVRQHVETTAVGHAHDHFACAVGRRELDQLVEHRHGHVESFDRELLLAQVGLVHEALEGVDLDQPAQQRLALVRGKRLAEVTGLDLLTQPHALAVRTEVFDLVCDRAAVGVAQVGECVGERRSRHVHPEDARRDAAHLIVGQVERVRVERRVALRWGAERVEVRGEVAVGAVSLEQRGRGLHGLQHQLVGAAT